MTGHLTKRQSGFSLLEMTVAVALGSVVLAAAVAMYTQGVSASFTVTQRAEMQEDFRAASNMLTKDLGLAGAGLGNGAAIQLVSGGSTPQYGCDQTNTCYINGVAGTYPLQGGNPFMYGLITGYDLGPIINATQGATDVVTVIDTDQNFYLNCYNAKVTSKGFVTFSEPTPWPPAGCIPNGVAAPQAVNDTAAGLTKGDLVFMTLNNIQIVAEVTGAVTTGTDGNGNPTYTVPFANTGGTTDPLKMNQTPNGGGLNSAPVNATGNNEPAPCQAPASCRLMAVTYYIDKTTTPARLMRMVSGHTPMPVVENIAWMKFSYDLYNDSTGPPAINQPNPGSGDAQDTASNGLLPNQITKINILNMAMNSTVIGTMFAQDMYQRMDLQTSVCARNLTYNNNYPN